MTSGDRTVVIGAGVIGVATAFELTRRGRKVLVLEARDNVGMEASYANGGLMTPAMSEPWNGPGALRAVASAFFNPGSAMRIRARAIPSLARWGVRFLIRSTAALHTVATRHNYLLSKHSVDLMQDLDSDLKARFADRDTGSIKIFRSVAAMRAPLAMAANLAREGLHYQELDARAAVRREPQLGRIEDEIAGAIYYPGDRVGDAHLFCKALARDVAGRGGTVRTGIPVRRIQSRKHGAVAVETDQGDFEAGTVVVAAGNDTPNLLAPLGVRVAVQPAKGYTLTYDAGGLVARPGLAIIDDAMHAGIVPTGDRLRVAGTAEFTGHDRSISRAGVNNLDALLKRILPDTARELEGVTGKPWAGLRPMSADGVPFIGGLSIPGLYVNTGHGHLGWTMALGAAHLLGDLIDGRAPGIPADPYRPERMQGA